MENVLQKSLRSLLEYSHKKYKNNKFLQFIDGPGYTFGSFYEKVKEVATTLSQYGIKKGDRVGLISQNMPNWGAAYFASTAFGSISVPMLPDFSESEIKHILKHSEAKALFVSKRLFSKIKQKAIDRLSLIISIDDWSILKGEKVENPEPLCSEDDIQSDELAAIIYTSGTTGSSKGVMLSHRNLCANLYAAQELRPSYEWDKWLSILPLSHTLEQSLSLLLPMLGGSQVFYMEKAPTPTMLLKSMQQVKPTTMLSVPLIIEKVYRSAVLPKFTKSKVMKSAYSFPPTRKLLNRVAGKKLMEQFGGNIRFFGIGGAKLDRAVEQFLLEAKFPYAIGYGLTETSPLIAGAIPSMVRLGSTGPIVHGVTAKLIDQNEEGIGEIVVKGDNVMMGYYKNPEATAAAFTEDGWFRTKDLGCFDKDGWLYIKGRASTTIIGPSGENIYPEDIETIINSHEYVSESLVTKRKGKLTALVHFDTEKLKSWWDSATNEWKEEYSEKLENLKKELLDYVNEKVIKFSKVSEIDVQKEEFEKTPTKKIKRFLYTKDEDSDINRKS